MRVVPRPVAALCAAALGVLAVVALPAGPASADDIRDRQWHLKALDIPAMHKITQGEGVTVAVVDTGVDAGHPDLKGNVLPGLDLFDDKTKGRVDRHDHGTAMAAIIAGHGHGAGNRAGILGIAPKAKILPVAIQAKKQGIISPKALAAGIFWAADHGADVINVSLTSSFDHDLNRAVDYAYHNNVILVASVGNRKDMLIGTPADHENALAVTGSDRKGRVGPQSIPAEQTDLAAPSVDIMDAAPGGRYSTSTSTSAATAVVSGAVALVRAKFPDLPSSQIFKRMVETTRDAGEPGRDQDFGWGILDLRRALTGQPDGRLNKVAPETSEPVYSWQVPSEGGSIWEILIPAISLPVFFLLLISPIVFLLVRRRRRRRQRAAEATSADSATYLGGRPADAVPLQPTTVQPATAPGPAGDDAVWRPPTS